jgi:mono/diheme cytochrome c family protein
LTTRTQRESRLLGFIVGAITSFFLVLVGSLLPWLDEDGTATSIPTTAATAAVSDSTPPATQQAGPTGSGRGRGGPPEGRGPGSQGNVDPLGFGVAGQEVLDAFADGGCVACHSIKGVGGEAATVGPHLFRLGVIAADRRPGDSVAAYIEESILDPDAFIMPNCPTGPCPSGVMPQTYGDTLSAEDLATIVDYLAVLGTPAEAALLTQP